MPNVTEFYLNPAVTKLDREQVESFLLQNYVQEGNKIVNIARPGEKLLVKNAKPVIHTALIRAFPSATVSSYDLGAVIDSVSNPENDDPARRLSRWAGAKVFRPGDCRRIIPNDTGTVSLNIWVEPAYRSISIASDSDIELFRHFMLTIFPQREERTTVLNWLCWNLQNENKRTRWGLMLYSKERGTGKSTLAQICRALFGRENSAAINGIDLLTQRFNAPVVTKKFVNAEEVNFRKNPGAAERLKMLFTDDSSMVEWKGVDAEQVKLTCCFFLTSNHKPYFLREMERRMWVGEVRHDGHASGPKAAEFAQMCDQIENCLQDDRWVAAVYRQLMKRPIPPTFNPNSLNVAKYATSIMQEILGLDTPRAA